MQYSISDLEQLSGVSVHNIRIWERRYGALRPSRTAGNTRFYDEDQLRRLLCIASLYNSGTKISKACALSQEEMRLLLQKNIDSTLSAEKKYEYYISQIIEYTMAYDEQKIGLIISDSFERNGVLDTYKFVIYPMLFRLGLMWLKETVCPSQEHFVSAIIRQKLFTAIDQCHSAEHSSASWLLFLPEDEDHDIGLLLASYLLRSADYKVIYLGPKLPFSALKNAAEATRPDNLLFFMTRIRPLQEAQDYVDLLSAQFPATDIYLSGNQKILRAIIYPANVKWLEDIREFEKIIYHEGKI
jgi:DNA-binding transcriptional MerR regulator